MEHDPTPTALEAPLMARLDALGITVETHRHPPVYTVAEAKALRGELPGAHIKNLLLRDRKRRLWLLTVLEDRRLDLKALRAVLGARGGLSFASAELLWETLGVRPGAVTPLAAINDLEQRVTVVLDRGLEQQPWVNCHPLHNAATTAMRPADLVRFLVACEHPPEWLSTDTSSGE